MDTANLPENYKHRCNQLRQLFVDFPKDSHLIYDFNSLYKMLIWLPCTVYITTSHLCVYSPCHKKQLVTSFFSQY